MKEPAAVLLIFFSLIPSLLAQERFRKSPPPPEPLLELRLPNVETVRLSNGLTLSVIFKENMPVIHLQLTILAGESSSPEKLPGMATFAALMLSRGTQNISSSKLEEKIESIGGVFSTSTAMDHSLWKFSFLDEYLDQALTILSDMILHPAFAEREIDAVKRTLHYDLLRNEKDPEFLAKRHLFKLLFKDHPYENFSFNSGVTKNFNQKELLAFFNKYYRPNYAHLVLVSSLNLKTATRKVSHYFNTWEKLEFENPPLLPPKPNEKERVCLIDMPQVKDCTIYLGNIIMPLANPDSFTFLVLNQVLAGTPYSRLFMNLRESKGYAYYAFSAAEFFKMCGVFMVSAKLTPDVSYLSVQEILKEMRLLAKEPISFFEIEQAKSYLIGNFPLQIEGLDNFSSRLAELKSLNMAEDYLRNYYKNIMFVNSDKVFEVAQKYPLLTPVIVLAGDKEVLLDHLSEFESVEVYDNKGTYQYAIHK